MVKHPEAAPQTASGYDIPTPTKGPTPCSVWRRGYGDEEERAKVN